MISCLAPVLGRNVLDLRGPARDASEAEANQVGKEKTRNSYGLVSDRPTRLYIEAPAPATTLDRPVMCT